MRAGSGGGFAYHRIPDTPDLVVHTGKQGVWRCGIPTSLVGTAYGYAKTFGIEPTGGSELGMNGRNVP